METPSTPLLRTRSVESTPSPNHHAMPSQASPLRTRTSSDKTSCLGTFRWVLLGVIIGSTATAFLQSIHLPSLCTNITVDGGDSTSERNPLHQMHQERLKAKKTKKQQSKQTQFDIIKSNTTADPADSEVFLNLPPPPILAPSDAFAACLLIKDDNHWLIEWLAYHYHVMPLRHLVVVIDPESKTSPRKILNRWQSRGLMDIRIWNDSDFMPQTITAKEHMFDNNTKLMMHRVRQNNFYRQCITTLRNRKREWVMLVDTDEYVLPSYASGHFRNLTAQIPFEEGGSVLRLLKYYEQVEHSNHTCVYMPRFFYGAKRSRPELVQHGVPTAIHAYDMLTQTYMFREPRRNYNGKNLLNTFRVRNLHTFGGAHHVATACPDPQWVRSLNQNKHALVRVHHYLGTPEQYLFRDDPRLGHINNQTNATKFGSYEVRGMTKYEKLNKKANHEDHAAKAWIRGFVQEMGVELTTNLLQGVGQVGVE